MQRNKHLRDLFYNKVRERKNYLHKCFIKFYYKGIMYQTVRNYNDKITEANQATNNNINMNMNIIPNLNDPAKDQNQNKENIINKQNNNINNNNINISNNKDEQNSNVNNINNINNVKNIKNKN